MKPGGDFLDRLVHWALLCPKNEVKKLGFITILRNGTPWLVCSPADQAELDRFKAAAAGGDNLISQPATAAEAGRLAAAKALHAFKGESPDNLFGTPL